MSVVISRPSSTQAASSGGAALFDVPLGHVMCVEDDLDIRALAELALGKLGHLKVTLCSCGENALSCIGEERPDLVLLDLRLPGIDGIETMRQLRQRQGCEAVPVVLMTAQTREADVRAYMAAGAAGVIAKPFNPMTLAAELRQLYANLRH